MWIPKDEQEIVSAMTNGSLEETLTFDAKREIPLKNIDTAKDVSALANTAGGVLLYGVDEDRDGRLTVLNPIVLENQRERIDQIVRSSVDEVPRFTISRIETQTDSSKGYLVVVVPPSERAPHMVVVKGERRFYGRGETGNYILSQTEVGRLYERRRLVDSNILPELEKAIEGASLADNDEFAHLHIVARPVFLDDTILTKALSPGQSHQELLRLLVQGAADTSVYRDQYSPDFQQPSVWTRRPDGYFGRLQDASDISPRPDAHTLHLQINLDGSARLFCGRAADATGSRGRKEFLSTIVAGNTTRLLALLGDLYEKASYFGMVDVALAVTGLNGSVLHRPRNPFSDLPRYEGRDYRRSSRSSAELLKEDSKQVAAQLLMPLMDAISQNSENPFKER
jgi:hypothetical protein